MNSLRPFSQLRRTAAATALVAAMLVGGASGAAAQDVDVIPETGLSIVLDLPGIGEQIELLSYSFGMSQSEAKGRRSTPKVNDIVVTKKTDAASPKLMLACANGKHNASAQLTVCADRACTQEYLKYELENVMVTSYSVGGGAAGDSIPTETLSLNFDKVKATFSQEGQSVEMRKVGSWWQVVEPR